MSSYPSTGQSVLRLVSDDHYPHLGEDARRHRDVVRETRAASLRPDLDPMDPRWILAAETQVALQGAALPPDRREKLLRLANQVGLRPFDANLVIAIVQDEARRGANGSELANRLRIIPPPATPSGFMGHPVTLTIAALIFAAAFFIALVAWITP